MCGVGGRAELRHRNNNFVQNLFCFKFDAMSVPDALATTIYPTGVLYRFSASMGVPGYGPALPLGDASSAPWAPPGHPLSTLGYPLPLVPMGPRRGGTPPEFRHPKNNNPIIVSILLRGAEFGMGGRGSKQFRQTQNFSIKNRRHRGGIPPSL